MREEGKAGNVAPAAGLSHKSQTGSPTSVQDALLVPGSNRLSSEFRRLLMLSAIFGLVIGTALPYEALFLGRGFELAPASTGGLLTAAGILTLPLQIGSGHMSDVWGRKRLIQLAILSAAAGCLALASAGNLVAAAVGIFLISAGIALYLPIAQAMAGDLAEPARREREFAWLFAAFGPGFALGPLIGGFAAGGSYSLVFAFAGLVAAAALVGTLALSETMSVAQPAEQAMGHAWQDRRVVLLGLVSFSIWLVICQLVVTVPLWVVRDLGYPNSVYGLMVSLNGILIFGGQALVTSRVMRFRSPLVLAVGALTTGVAYGLMVFHSVPTLLLGSLLISVGQMLIVPTTNAMLDRMAPPGRRGQYQGAGAFVQSVGFTVGPLPGGVLLQVGGGLLLWPVCFAWAIATSIGYVALAAHKKL
jgi:MFS family permease